ncbi:MAG: cytochrome c [Rhodospirillales bacterium]|nr:cytochrome c [Rhodospirillales bacterium]
MPASKRRRKTKDPSGVGLPGGGGGGGAKRSPALILVALAAALGAGAFLMLQTTDVKTINVHVPSLTAKATAGQKVFNATCAECHGDNAAGGPAGPPLITSTYHPGHHADGAFRRAVALGVPQHHWKFGNMPPQPKVSGAEIDALIAFIRELQKANGIY